MNTSRNGDAGALGTTPTTGIVTSPWPGAARACSAAQQSRQDAPCLCSWRSQSLARGVCSGR